MNSVDPAELAIPDEPRAFKAIFQRQLATDLDLGESLIRQSSWLSVLWTGARWKVPLRRCGMTWQRFLKVAHWLYKPFVAWAKSEIPWEEAVVTFRGELIALEGPRHDT